jgi:hypothetical protein
VIALKLGAARAGVGDHGGALASFARARELNVRGAFDLGVPAVRAAVRAGDRAAAIDWLRWTLRGVPAALVSQIERQPDVAALLRDPEIAAAVRRP